MSVDGWNSVLVLGGIRSGKSDYAGSLVADVAKVRYVSVTPPSVSARPEHPVRPDNQRPGWIVEEVGADPSRLIELITAALPGETLLVDDLGDWVRMLLDPAHRPTDGTAAIDELARAVRDCTARLILVSPEVGLSVAPSAPAQRALVDALGTTNQAIGQVCDALVLVVAGQPVWLKPGAPARPVSVPAQLLPAPGEQIPGAPGVVIRPGMDLPMPDEDAGPRALQRLATLDLPGPGLGNLERVVSFAAGTQGTDVPSPWRSIRVMLLHGDHDGGASAGTVPGEAARRADQARAGEGPLARLAAGVGATLQVIDAPPAAPMESGSTMTEAAVESALHTGWRLAEEAVESGVQLIVLASCGAGTEAAATAVLAALAGAEPAAVLNRVITADGRIDDGAWMTRCAAIRDALHRIRHITRASKELLAELGGGDMAIATGILLGATARRTPVLLDGPVGVAAGLLSRDFAGQARHWCLLPDHGGDPAVQFAADVLGLTPLVDLRVGLGEGATALTVLPMLNAALALVGALPPRPAPGALRDPQDAPEPTAQTEGGPTEDRPAEDRPMEGEPAGADEFVEPEPAGPGPTRVPQEPTEDEPETARLPEERAGH